MSTMTPSTMALSKQIRLELSEAFLYFCYHLERKEYIKIDTPPGQEAGIRYIVTVSNYHWIRERNITSIALLAYATQRAQVAGNNLKSAIKEAPREEVLHMKIAEQECLVNLVEVILKKNTEIFSLENPPAKANEQINAINTVVEFIRAKHIKPSCKKLPEDTMSIDFNAALLDENTIDLAREATRNIKPAEDVMKEWQEQLNAVA